MEANRGKKETPQRVSWLKDVWGNTALSHIPALSSLQRKSPFFVYFVAQISQVNVPTPHLENNKVCVHVSSHACVSTAGWASCPISVRPDMIRRQIVSPSSLPLSGPWRFCSEVRKGLNADIVRRCLWYPCSTEIEIHWKQASTNEAIETETNGWCYIEREQGMLLHKMREEGQVGFDSVNVWKCSKKNKERKTCAWIEEEDALCGHFEVCRRTCRLFYKVIVFQTENAHWNWNVSFLITVFIACW